MRISNVPAIFFVSFLVSGILYFPTAEAKLVFDFVDFIRSYHETGWNIYDSANHHLSPYWVSKVVVTSLYLLFGFAAQPWHWVSCLFLAANISLLFAWLRNLLLFAGSKQAHTIAASAALLFIVVPYHHAADLRTAAMHHDRMHAHELQKNDVCGEFAGGFGIAHGVAAIFHNNDLAIIDLDIGQRFRERLGGSQALGQTGGMVFGGLVHEAVPKRFARLRQGRDFSAQKLDAGAGFR